MGLQYRYQLYFKREHTWDVLQAVTEIAESHDPPTVIHFPGYERFFPFEGMQTMHKIFHYDDAQMTFALTCLFPEDEAIVDFLKDRGDEIYYLSPLQGILEWRIPLHTVYLTIYQENAFRSFPDLVLFSFDTTGSLMSLLFDESPSIRETFTGFLERHQGICGVLNREANGGEVYWLKGKRLSMKILDPFMLPDEIEFMLNDQLWKVD